MTNILKNLWQALLAWANLNKESNSLNVSPSKQASDVVMGVQSLKDEAQAPSPGSLSWYAKLYNQALLKTDKESLNAVDWAAGKIVQNRARYLWVEKQTGTPWQLVGAIHGLEASFNFNTCLHNGDPLNAKTVHVPKGRGPFATWEAGAVDALHYDGIIISDSEKWTVERMLQMAERYNGLGYLKFHTETLSPYLWSCTNLYTSGKYADDGKFDLKLVSKQAGVAAIFKKLDAVGLMKEFKT